MRLLSYTPFPWKIFFVLYQRVVKVVSGVLGLVVWDVNILLGFQQFHSLFPVTCFLFGFFFVLNAFLQVKFSVSSFILWRVNDISSFLLGLIQRNGKLYKQKLNWKCFTDAAMPVINWPLYVKYATNLSKTDGFLDR